MREVSLQAFEKYVLESSANRQELFRVIREASAQGLPRFNVCRMLFDLLPIDGSWEEKRAALEASRQRWAALKEAGRGGAGKSPLAKDPLPKNPLMKNPLAKNPLMKNPLMGPGKAEKEVGVRLFRSRRRSCCRRSGRTWSGRTRRWSSSGRRRSCSC